MKTFELTLNGFNMDRDDTDELVWWVKAPSIDAVNKRLAKVPLALLEEPRYLEGRDKQISRGECDFVLNAEGEIIQSKRPSDWTDSLKTRLLALAGQYATEQGTGLYQAFRDILTDTKHICRERGWEWETILAGAEACYDEERESVEETI